MTTSFAAQIASQAAALETLVAKVCSAVDRTNGRRRDRLIAECEVWTDVLDAINTGASYRHGGHVANAYKYRAVATVLLLRAYDGQLHWYASEANAKKGSTGIGRVAAALESWTNWHGEAEIVNVPSRGDCLVAADVHEENGDTKTAASLRRVAKLIGE